ncbi:MAG: InlB B-repeat-containing protein, partial [Bacteroidales bacterium]|nr:InlB B-repeat-containing protein [Bacteroidales bacterium]
MRSKNYTYRLRQMMLKCFALVLFLTAGVAFSTLMAQNQGAVANRTISKQVSATNVAVTGQMPQTAQVSVTKVQRSAVQGKQVKGAYDITIQNGNKVWQPQTNKPVMVTISDANFNDGVELDVYHEGANGLDFVATVTPVNGQITFPARSFSVYIVTESGAGARLKVNFHQIDSSVVTIYVKALDTVNPDMYKTVLYDPGVGSLDSIVQFRGWYTSPSYTVANADQGMTIAQVREHVKPSLTNLTDGSSLDLYPLLFKLYHVTYLDELGSVINSKEVLYLPYEDENYHSCVIDETYIPTSSEQNFQGWKVEEGASHIDGYTSGTVYQNNTTISINGNIKLKADVPFGHWLVFKENGKGATYVAPQFIENGETTSAPTVAMARFGYTFGGWYTDEACTTGHEFSFGSTLDSNTTIYAKWTANTSANYTIIIWKQNVHDAKDAADANKTYDFAESVSLTGTVGQTVNTVSATGTGNDRYAIVDGDNIQYEGFHLNTYDTNVTIVTEGTAVVNVYYDRNLVTLTFREGGGYGNGNNNTILHTLTGLYGSSLSENGYTWPNEYWWYEQNQNGGSGNTRTTFLDAFILSDGSSSQTFWGFSGSGTNTIHFMKQNDAGGYTEANTVTSSGGTFWISDKYNGYYAYQSSTNGNTWTTLGDKDPQTGYYGSMSSATNMYVRYNRRTYNLLYKDGIYVNGDGAPITDETNRGELNVVENIPFESSIASYNKGGANYYEPTYSGYVFEGWYIDDQCTQAYTFTNMPEGLTVYAKWRQVQYRVFLHPNAVDPETNAVDSTLDWGSENQAMCFRISNGAKVSIPTGIREDYTLVGWYTDPEFTHVFNAEIVALTDQVVTTPYDKTEDMTDLMDKWGNIVTDSISPTTHDTIQPWNSDAVGYNGADRFWITKKLDLYAKWRSKLEGAKGIHINYVYYRSVNQVDTILVFAEEDLFNDNVSAFSIPAPTEFNGMPNPQDSVFFYWVIQHWDTTQGKFVDSDETVYPGSPFSVSKADAQRTNNPTYDPEALVVEDQYIYTIQIRAEYIPVEKVTPTFIVWYNNYQGADPDTVRQDGKLNADDPHANLFINQAVSIPTPAARSGYTFKGWYKLNSSTPIDSIPHVIDTLVTPNFLYFNEEDSLYYSDAAFTTQADSVAADEANPYDYLYAVWEANGYYVRFNKVEDDAQGTMAIQEFSFDVKDELTQNAFTYTDHCFQGWDTQAAAATVVYQDKDSVLNLAQNAGDTVDLYAVWEEKLTPEFELETSYCVGAEVTLPTTSTNEVAGTWNPASVNTSEATTAPVTYTFTPTDTCHAVYTIDITINPTYAVTDKDTICANQLPYTWNDSVFTAAGEKTTTLQAVNGCDSVVTMILTVNPLPEVAINTTAENNAICSGTTATLTASGAETYVWNTGDETASIEVAPTQTTTYTVTGTDANGCENTGTVE